VARTHCNSAFRNSDLEYESVTRVAVKKTVYWIWRLTAW